MNQECTEGVANTKLLLEWSSLFEKFTCSGVLGEVSEWHWQRRGPLNVIQQHFHPHRAATLPRSPVATPSFW